MILIFVSILLVGGVFLFSEYRNRKVQNTYTASADISSIDDNIEAENIDTDGDGLKDWEEILLGSDSKDAKSMGEISKKSSIQNDSKIEKVIPTNTELLGKDFFARYMELRQMGISGDKQSQQDAMSQSVENILASSQPKTYTVANIIIDNDISKESIKNYGNSIDQIFKMYSIKSRNEAVITKDSVDRQDSKILNELDPIILSYKNILNGIIKIKAPSTISRLHLDLINSISGLIFVSELFKKSDKDPMSGIQAASNYLKYAEAFNNSYLGIRSYLTFLGVNPTTDGSLNIKN